MILSIAEIPENLLEMVKERTGESITVCEYRANTEKALQLVQEAEILLTWAFPVNEGLFDKIDDFKLGWIFALSVGVDHMPFQRLKEHGTVVSTIRGLSNSNVSEHILSLMLSFSRRLPLLFENQKKKLWDTSFPMDELYSRTLCIVGAGNIGVEVAKKAKAFGMRVIGVDLFPRELPEFDAMYGLEGKHTALAQADYVVTVVPLTPDTYHLIGAEDFAVMKETAIFLNTSRGDVIDEEALIRALEQKQIAGAGLDVFHTEPLGPESPLWGMENVILTPHRAGDSCLMLDRAMELFAKSLLLYRKGEKLPNQLNLDKGY